MKVHKMDHFVLTVEDSERACEFYSGVLGMKVLSFGEGRKALSFGEYKINLHEAVKEFTPNALMPTPGSIDVCLLTETPLDNVIQHLIDHGVPVIEGPVL
ncbi:putative ring-cleavage extradiol dioxygenase [Desulfosporosinus acidiphilus SJ4]|uniref:Putative ring-cleavage extradiol dioxygenase n=1 Tax=Desulfosporosinus acidiphilus (strain DSM 22704 / JCM 16185 / SJ4) TaxID=646529 RepID=I4D2L3_DESAJ|nr:VOC family protein [Desulfosporosinus acidiphilus]AFM40037.1 putative ring-cleavage extradiol dioxygenase [Desulfosporosinus acidiphilus SJ4]